MNKDQNFIVFPEPKPTENIVKKKGERKTAARASLLIEKMENNETICKGVILTIRNRGMKEKKNIDKDMFTATARPAAFITDRLISCT